MRRNEALHPRQRGERDMRARQHGVALSLEGEALWWE